jgi:ubiquinone/menaquinone biosynthesis C-methylase UbiE
MPSKFPSENWEVLLNKERQQWQNVDKFIEIVKPKKDEVWADIGCGPGYFALPLAKKVKKLYAIDLEEKMLNVCRERAKQENLENIEFLKSEESKIPLEDNSVDVVLLANIYHELHHPKEFLNELKRILKENGKVIVMDWHPVPSPSGPPLEERIPEEKVLQEIQKEGFQLLEKHDIYPYHYFLIFKK